MLPLPRRQAATRVIGALICCALSSAWSPVARADDTPLPGCTQRVVRVENGAATLINTATLQILASTVVGPGGSVVTSPNCCYYAVVNPSASIDVINGADGTTARHSAPVGPDARVEFSPDWCGVAIINPSGSVIVINLVTGTSVTSSPVGPTPGVTWGPVGCLYAIVNPNGSVIVVNGDTGVILTTLGPVGPNVRVEFSSDGCLYAVIQPGGSVLIYRANGELVGRFSPVGNNVTVTFGPNCTFSVTDPPTASLRHTWGALKHRYR